MFMEPFKGLISGPLNQLAFGSAQGSADALSSLGLPESEASALGGFGMMPGWLIALLFNSVGL